jgi:hypothetical protein
MEEFEDNGESNGNDGEYTNVSSDTETDPQELVIDGWGSRGIVICLHPLNANPNPVIDGLYDKSIFIVHNHDFIIKYQRNYKSITDPVWIKNRMWTDEYLTTANVMVGVREIQSVKTVVGMRAD